MHANSFIKRFHIVTIVINVLAKTEKDCDKPKSTFRREKKYFQSHSNYVSLMVEFTLIP